MIRRRIAGRRLLGVVLFSFLTCPPELAAQKCTAPSVSLTARIPTGFDPTEMAIGAFDQDGFLDLAVVLMGNQDVGILKGSAGGFSLPTTIPFPATFDLVAEDFNHDGWDDLAVSGFLDDRVYIRLNDGLGGFPALSFHDVGNGPAALTSGDYDDDGHPDLAVFNANDTTITVLLGDGAGGFTRLGAFLFGGADQLLTGDVNRDGKPDLVSVDRAGRRVLAALSNGTGTFPTIEPSPVNGLDPESLVLDHFDGDGVLDVVTVSSTSRDVELLTGDGDGKFSPAGTFPVGGDAHHRIAAGDLDRDGDLDLVVPQELGTDFFILLREAGGFSAPTPFDAAAGSMDALIEDFDGDGRNDVALSLRFTDEVFLAHNDLGLPCPEPSLARTGRFLAVGNTPSALASGDFDQDGTLDLVAANQLGNDFSYWRAPFFRDLASATSHGTGAQPVSIAVANLDSDLKLDLVTANQGTGNLVVHQNLFGGFSAGLTVPLSGTPVQVVAADVSSDGQIDLISALASGDVVVALNDGAGGFPSPIHRSVGGTLRAVAVADFDQDALPDIAVADAANQVLFLKNGGGGTFLSADFLTVSGPPTSLRAADMNSDGLVDLVVTTGDMVTGSLRLYLGQGPFDFLAGATLPIEGAASSPHGLEIADFNRDGIPDVAVAVSGNPRVRIAIGAGDGTFSATFSEIAPAEVRAIAAGDFDRDGFLDLVATQPGKVLGWSGDGQGRFSPLFLPADVDAESRGAAAHGDFDRDGTVDLAVANAGTDDVSVFFGQGEGKFGSAQNVPIGALRKPVWVTAGDFDDDGRPDLVVSAEGTSELLFLGGAGDGSFDPPLSSGLLANPSISRAGDFDLDGDLDLIVLLVDAVGVYTGDGTGRFDLLTSFGLGGLAAGLVVGDLDRNGLLDFAATDVGNHYLHLFIATGPGDWVPVAPMFLGGSPGDLDLGDWNHDGWPDLAVPLQWTDRILTLRNDGAGGFLLDADFPVPVAPSAVRALDLNGDGRQDLLVASKGEHVLASFLGDGTGNFVGSVLAAAGLRVPTWLSVADLDRDSRTDIAVVPDTSGGLSPPGLAVVLNTNCKPRRLFLDTDVSSCDLPGSPFVSQPVLRVLDDGENWLQCETGPIAASVFSGPGSLLGTTPVLPSAGLAVFTDLAVSSAGTGYRLAFEHAQARPILSRSFSQALSVAITGPAQVCEGDSAVYDAGPGYEAYAWHLDSAPVPIATTQTVDASSLLTAGTRLLEVLVSQDSCSAGDFLNVEVQEPLSIAGLFPAGPIGLCESCFGPLAEVFVNGGGTVSYQWGYRIDPGGDITILPGETGSTYSIDGSDFPPGPSYLVVTVVPTCGTPLVSDEIPIDVASGAGPAPLVTITALSTKGQNRLEWAAPPAAGACTIRILRSAFGFPGDPNDLASHFHVGGTDFLCPAAGKDSFTDSGLTDDTRYYYSAFVKDGSDVFSPKVEVAGRPFDHTISKVKWAYSTGASSMAQAGIRIPLAGPVSLYVVSNDELVHGILGGSGGGQWLPGAKPFDLGSPSQARPPVVRFQVGSAANGAVFVTSQDGNLYALDADQLNQEWMGNVGEMATAGAAGIFSHFGASQNQILAGTRNDIAANGLRAFDVDSGALQWTFVNSGSQNGDDSPVGKILGSATVDYDGERVFFGSLLDPAGGNSSLWAVGVGGGVPDLLWSRNLGDIPGSPVFLRTVPPRIVVGTASGMVELLEASDGSSVWSTPYDASDGAVNGFVFPHPHGGSSSFLFATLNKVTSIRDNGPASAPTQNWQIMGIPFPSTPIFLPNTNTALVGASDGRLYQLSAIDGAAPNVDSILLGDGASTVGVPSFDVANDLIYVGTEEGVIYAVEYPIN